MAEELLRVEHLCKSFPVKGRRGPGIQAVRDVSFSIRRGETLGLVGESGCGKTTLGRTLLRLHEPTSGRILYRGTTLFARDLGPDGRPGRTEAVDMLPYRRQMQIIFQDPSSSLDPRMTAGEIIGEAIDIHHLAQNRAQRTRRIRELLELVGLRGEDAGRYPHAFSGGQQQRVGIARALAVEPEFLVCDEPISALDVSIQAQVVNLLEDMQRELKLTQVLLSAVPTPDPRAGRGRIVLQGEIPSPLEPPPGCPFHPRCPRAVPACARHYPPMREITPGHFAACHRAEESE